MPEPPPTLAERAQWWLACGLAAAATSPGLLLMGVPDDPKAPENPLFRLAWIPVYAGVLLLCAWRAPRLAKAWPGALLCGALVGWAAASQHWSILPDVTHRRVIALALTTLLGVMLGALFDGRRFVELLAAGSLALAVGSVAVALADPKIGVMVLDGQRDWRGLYPHKNVLAFVMAVGALSAVCAALASPARRRLWIATALTCLALLLLSRGKTSLVGAGLVILGAGALAVLRRGPVAAVVASWIGAAAATAFGVAAAVAPDALLRAIGKDPTLTGRTDIWASVLRRSAERPRLGYGFGAFWEKDSLPAKVVQHETHWLVPSAHNGWLDLLVQVGWVGVGLFAAVLLLTFLVLAVRLHRADDAGFGLLYLVLLIFFSLSESVIEAPNTLSWALFAAVVVRALSPRASLVARPRPAPSRAPPPPLWRDAQPA